MFIEPKFEREQAETAWVIPCPVLPEVLEANTDFIDQLNLVTTPLFVEYCQKPHCGCHCGPIDAYAIDTATSAPEGEPTATNTPVTVWAKGTVGILDYLVLTAQSGQELAEWLLDNAYVVPGELATGLDVFDGELTFYVVAKISQEADPSLPLSPLRLRLPGLTHGSYPLGLTGMQVPAGKTLGVTLWVITPLEELQLPASHAWEFGKAVFAPDEWWQGVDAAGYNKGLADYFAASMYEGIGLVYTGPLSDNVFFSNKGQLPNWLAEFYYDVYDVSPYDLSQSDGIGLEHVKEIVELPESWCPEVDEIIQNQAWAMRFETKLSPSGMTQDLEFLPAAEVLNDVRPQSGDWSSLGAASLLHWPNVYFAGETGPCHECAPCVCPSEDIVAGSAGSRRNSLGTCPAPR